LDLVSVKTKIIPSVGEYYNVYKWLIDVIGRVRTSENSGQVYILYWNEKGFI
jgi:hypothetical protein